MLALTLAPGAAIGDPPALQLPAPFAPLAPPAGSCVAGTDAAHVHQPRAHGGRGQPDTSDVAAGPCGDVVVTGDVPQGALAHVDAAVDQPDALALRYFTAALAQRGIEVLPPAATAGPIPGVVDAPFSAATAGRGGLAARRRAATERCWPTCGCPRTT